MLNQCKNLKKNGNVEGAENFKKNGNFEWEKNFKNIENSNIMVMN